MKLDTLLQSNFNWALCGDAYHDVILGSLTRVVRSLSDHCYPGWSLDEQRKQTMDYLRPHVLALPSFKTSFHTEICELTWQQRRLLLERKLISPCMAARQDGCEVFIPKKQDCFIMTNEEEHLVIHCSSHGLALRSCHKRALKLADTLEQQLSFAQNPETGYLTSLPYECGDAVQLFILMHLPAMTCTSELSKVHTALEKLDLELSSVFADEKEETGNLFILRCQPPKKGDTGIVMKRLIKIATTMAQRELKLREHIYEVHELEARDLIGRSMGIIRYASRLSYSELVDSISLISLGLHLGILETTREELSLDEINNELFTLPVSLGSAHLRQRASLPVEGSTLQIQALRSQLAQTTLDKLSIQFKPYNRTI